MKQPIQMQKGEDVLGEAFFTPYSKLTPIERSEGLKIGLESFINQLKECKKIGMVEVKIDTVINDLTRMIENK